MVVGDVVCSGSRERALSVGWVCGSWLCPAQLDVKMIIACRDSLACQIQISLSVVHAGSNSRREEQDP